MSTVSNAMARQDEKPTVAQFIHRLTPEIQRALPKGMDGDRIARLALTAIRKDRALAECNPESFAGALLTAAALGLDPGVNGEAYLVAYKGECTLIVGYQGYARLFYQHPLARHLDAQAVHANDVFDYAYGLDPYLTHKPALGDRGEIVAYYACASLKTDAKAFVVLTPTEIKDLRNSTRPQKIADPQHWMERKTALRQLFKLLPKSTQMLTALDADERPGSELARDRAIESTPPPAIEQQRPAGVDANGVIDDDPNAQWDQPEAGTNG